MIELRDKIVVVTGGSRGIGRAIVLDAVARGAKVSLCARSLGPACDEVLSAAAAAGHGDAVLATAADVSNEEDVERLFDRTIDAWGRVDVVVNNAGINQDALLVQLEVEAFDQVIATNLTGAFLVARRGIQEFLAQGDGGRIVSIGSLSARGATSQSAYAASKGGLVGLTRTIAKEYGPKGVSANIVAVGLVDTELSRGLPVAFHKFLIDTAPLRRSGSPEEIARVVAFLASSRAGYINGEVIHVTGGLEDVSL